MGLSDEWNESRKVRIGGGIFCTKGAILWMYTIGRMQDIEIKWKCNRIYQPAGNY